MRKVYHYDESSGEMVEGPAPRKQHSGDGWLFNDRLYSGTPFVGDKDGTVIDSRKKHREYMERHGLTTIDDYTNEWAAAGKRREKFFKEGGDQQEHRARREHIERAIHKLEK